MPGETHRIRVLHISDLHAGKEPAALHGWQRRRVLGDSWNRNIDEILDDGRAVDLVCFTGDLAWSGQEGQYDEVTAFLSSLLERLELGWDRLFPVPGNHDVDRSVHEETWQKLRNDLGPEDATELSRWLVTGRAPRGFQDAMVDEVLERQSGYRHWLSENLAHLLPTSESAHPRLGYRVHLEVDGLPVHVIGLDSGWLAGDDHDHGELAHTRSSGPLDL